MKNLSNNLEWLQNWYKLQCDGDWEHEYGITIKTVDNPGWYLVINLKGTECEDLSFSPIKFDENDQNWFFCLVRENNFEASCDPSNLTKILRIFRDWVENEGGRV